MGFLFLLLLLATGFFLAVLLGVGLLLFFQLHRKKAPQGFPIDLHNQGRTK